MLTPEYLQGLPIHIVKIFEELEEEIIADIARRIKNGTELTETAEYQARILAEMGYDPKEVNRAVRKATLKAEDLLFEAADLAYANDINLYKIGGKILQPLQENIPMVNFINAIIEQTKGEFRNLTGTLGFVDNGIFKPMDTFYRDTLDYAVFQLGSGAFDYNTVLRQAVKKLGDSGVRSIDYESGRAYQIESAARMTIMTGVTQITGHMSLANADMMGQDLMEITAHMGARPDHAEWQGQIVSRSGRAGYLSLDDIGYGDVAGFQGANCRHDWYPFFEGISEPVYTKKQLKNIDHPPFEFDGRKYTAYEASQKQRQIERAIRKTKREIIAYQAAELDDEHRAASIKLRRQRELYEEFSDAAGLRAKHERTHTYGYGRSQSMRAVWARR